MMMTVPHAASPSDDTNCCTRLDCIDEVPAPPALVARGSRAWRCMRPSDAADCSLSENRCERSIGEETRRMNTSIIISDKTPSHETATSTASGVRSSTAPWSSYDNGDEASAKGRRSYWPEGRVPTASTMACAMTTSLHFATGPHKLFSEQGRVPTRRSLQGVKELGELVWGSDPMGSDFKKLLAKPEYHKKASPEKTMAKKGNPHFGRKDLVLYECPGLNKMSNNCLQHAIRIEGQHVSLNNCCVFCALRLRPNNALTTKDVFGLRICPRGQGPLRNDSGFGSFPAWDRFQLLFLMAMVPCFQRVLASCAVTGRRPTPFWGSAVSALIFACICRVPAGWSWYSARRR